jgi:hypothetical protein
MIQNYDTNGLVFAYNSEKMEIDQDDRIYHKALQNILDSQGFECIPLIDGPRIRLNTNNMKDRAVYHEDGGILTHIVRRTKYDDEEGLQFIPVEEITHVPNSTDLIEAIISLFSYQEGGKCNFVITVGGTPSQPDAIFTIRELLLEKTLRDIFFRMAHEGFSADDKDMAYRAYDLYENLEDLRDNSNWINIEKALPEIKNYLSMIPISKETRDNRMSDFNIETDFSKLKVRDIMTMAACGLETSISNEKTDSAALKMAFKMLSEANDFSCLVVYENGVLNPKKMMIPCAKNSYKIKFPANVSKSNDLVKDIIYNMKTTKYFFATIEPDPKIITGEGPMVWPGFLTIENLTSTNALLTYAATCAMIESKLKQRARNCKIPVGEKDTLGSVITKMTWEENYQYVHTNAMKIFKGKVSKDELHKLIAVRNKIIHESLMKCYSRNLGKSIELKDVQLIYKISEILGIN